MGQKPALAFDQVLSVSGYGLRNGRMPCKQKCWIRI